MKQRNFKELEHLITNWASERGFLKAENSSKQFMKITEELGELAKADLNNNQKELVDSIGDTFVTLILYAKMKNLDPLECLNYAYNEIKDRKGKTVNGTFIKDL